MSNCNAQINMIKQQLRTSNVLDESILSLYERLPREAFVPKAFQQLAYSDMHIPLNHQQCMMTPVEEASILQALSLQGHEKILEIGTGSGFLTALLSQLAQEVISIDYYAEFTTQAKNRLEKFNCSNVNLITGDAYRGWVKQAPYDVIIFTGAVEQLTEAHKLQVLPQGKLFIILGQNTAMRGQLYQLDAEQHWKISEVFETHLPRLVNPSPINKFIF